ncbi:hypothetical protein M153_13972000577, partial [Pseudoloma neurophilia]
MISTHTEPYKVLVDISTRPQKGYAEIVNDRTSTTLLEVIECVIRPGSIINTDEWHHIYLSDCPISLNIKQ